MAEHMRAELVCDALEMAIGLRRPPAVLIVHSDRGSQYTSRQFTELLASHGLRQSLSRPGQCWDNAVAESRFSTLKVELIHWQMWATRAVARPAIVDYIEVFLQPTAAALFAGGATWSRPMSAGKVTAQPRGQRHLM